MLGNVDKTYLSAWRLLHVVALGYLTLILLSPQTQWLTRAWATGIGRLGRHSLEIFSVGTILSFVGWVVLVEAGYGLALQILVNIIGIGILLGMAWALAQRNRGTDWVFVQSVQRFFAERRSSGVQASPA